LATLGTGSSFLAGPTLKELRRRLITTTSRNPFRVANNRLGRFLHPGFQANPGLTLANAFSVTRLLHSSKRATAARENVMPDSYTNLLYHIVFSTKDRRPIIAPEYEPRIYYYIGGTIRSLVGGTIRSLGGICLELNGTLPASKN
jgi:hypothetical protein